MKTAVEYLAEAIKTSNKDTFNDLFEYIEVVKQMEKNCFVEKIILKDGYRACCGKEMTEDAAEKYCKDVWLKP